MAVRSSVSRHGRTGHTVDLWVRRICAVVVAVVAAYASYVHQRDFALQGGADETSAALWPLSVDGLLLLATTGLLSPATASSRRTRGVMWTAFLLGIAVSLAANIAAAPTLDWQSVLVAGWPPVALLLSVELLAPHGDQRPARSDTSGPPRAAELPRPTPDAATGSRRAPGTTKEEATEESARTVADGGGDKAASTGSSLTGIGRTAEPARRHVTPARIAERRPDRSTNETFAPDDALVRRARAEDARHRQEHQRPISGETLRKRLHVGARTSRVLISVVRAEQGQMQLSRGSASKGPSGAGESR